MTDSMWTMDSEGKRGQSPFVRSTLRAVPANGDCPLFPAEGWRLNLCCNQPSGNSTWAAVGNNFHSPDAFGELIAQVFATWREAQPEQLRHKRAAILQAAGPRASRYTDRLAALEAAATPGVKHAPSADWKAITRAYAQMNYVGHAYRCLEEEVRYAKFFE
jgi:hypothetical protein